MEVLYNNLAFINPDETYVFKTCNCGSKLRITNKDALSVIPQKDNEIILTCPCCGQKIYLEKYLTGNKYNIDEYSLVVSMFQDEANELYNFIDKVSYGFGTMYFTLSKISIIAKATKIIVDIYINKFDENWDKEIAHNVFYASREIELSKKIDCGENSYSYAKHSQALFDFLRQKKLKDGTRFTCGFLLLSIMIEENMDELKSIFRNGDFSTSEQDVDSLRIQKIKKENQIMKQTIYTPDVQTGLEYVGDKVEIGCDNIATAILMQAIQSHNDHVMMAGTTQNHNVSVSGHCRCL